MKRFPGGRRRQPGRTPVEVFGVVRDHCRRKWPRDYYKRDACEADNLDAFRVIESLMGSIHYDPEDLKRIRSFCERSWPSQYTMQEGCIQDQLDGL